MSSGTTLKPIIVEFSSSGAVLKSNIDEFPSSGVRLETLIVGFSSSGVKLKSNMIEFSSSGVRLETPAYFPGAAQPRLRLCESCGTPQLQVQAAVTSSAKCNSPQRPLPVNCRGVQLMVN